MYKAESNKGESKPRALAPEDLEKVPQGLLKLKRIRLLLRCEYGFTDYCNGHDCFFIWHLRLHRRIL
jgi:hypothetical protein